MYMCVYLNILTPIDFHVTLEVLWLVRFSFFLVIFPEGPIPLKLQKSI
jgi:hypothetical protein